MIVILSIIKSLYNLLILRLSFPKEYNDKIIQMDDGLNFRIFRHMKLSAPTLQKKGSILIVRFKFKKFSHQINKRLSNIPILLIAGFPGFKDKLWVIDEKSGFWQGIYLWENKEAIEEYKHSFVLRIMNKRTKSDTISFKIVNDINLDEFIKCKILS
ncbi:MAG: YdhR family protein [Sedimentisphaerales bacterium]